MSTTSLVAGEVMDRSAALLNDPAKTDYTYIAQIPYLNMAIDELIENLEESNAPLTNLSLSPAILIPIGTTEITPIETGIPPNYPIDLIEIQEVGDRIAGSQDAFIEVTKHEFLDASPANNAFLYWVWENQIIKFNPTGANSDREIQLKYIRQAIQLAIDETSVIGVINARSYLSYKTAALCAMFIGENETRAEALDSQAEKALERVEGINNKGRQQIMTRHRPFRAAYKARGAF